LIVLGKVARRSFAITGAIPNVPHAGDIFYVVGLVAGILLWSFALVWFIVAIIMIASAFPFPFNMGWWGFIFPVGEFKSTVPTHVAKARFGKRSFHPFNNFNWRRI
jgi:tellurite resistance protein TehA-like permease